MKTVCDLPEAASAGTGTENRTPRPPTLAHLIAIWTRVLGISPVVAGTNFFEVGGDSLLAMGLLLDIERETGCSIPFTAIYDAPTVEAMHAFLHGQANPNFSPLVCLKRGERAPPFFVVHGIGGTVMELSGLAGLIERDGPVYGVQARGIDGSQFPLDSIEDMASYYLAAVREKQPAGPYFVGGYSFGGLIAVEMCRQLKREGEEIGLLVLIDSYAHPRTWPLPTRLAVRLRRLRYRISELASQPLPEIVCYILSTANRSIRLMAGAKAVDPSRRGDAVSSWLDDHAHHLPPVLRSVRAAGEKALSAYVPHYYPDKITFVRAETSDRVFPVAPAPIWRPLARELALHTVKGSHFTLVGDHAASLAARLSQSLGEARRAHSMAGSLHRSCANGPESAQLDGASC